MILRRCRFIVVSDASTDTSYDFSSLAMAIRQIRVDFGVPIDMEKMTFGSNPDSAHNYCAIGKIRYSCVDKAKKSDKDALYDGVLIYIKPALIGGEPRDILNYHRDNPTFPEETIVDQWFSEPQFESYRALEDLSRNCRSSRSIFGSVRAAGTGTRRQKAESLSYDPGFSEAQFESYRIFDRT
jgi:hypothetical protein